ncbi:MAG: DNRLRE domain-containing protein, partial [Planctomycetota bacterium]
MGKNLTRLDADSMWGSLSTRLSSRRNQALRRLNTSAVVEAFEDRLVLSGVTLQVSARQDSSIYATSSGDLSNGAGEFIVTGGPTTGTGVKRGLVQFDLSTVNIPSGSTIIDVVLKMSLVNSTGGSAAIGLHRITSPWLEAGSNAPGDETNGGQAHEFDATWKWSLYDGLLWKTAGGDFGSESSSAIVDTPGAYEWSGEGLIDDVQSWLDSPTANFGWMVIGPESAGDVKSFASRQSANAAIRPMLEISYEEPIVPPMISGRQWNDLDGNGLRTSQAVVNLNLQFSQGKTFFNSLGGNEYWYRSGNDNAWYFLTPDGNLTRWDNTAGKLTGTLVENVSARTWHSPQSLLASSTVSVEPWLNGVTIELVSTSGAVIDTTVTRNLDLNSDGVIQQETESGWYRFGSIPQGQYSVRQAVTTGWTPSPSSTPSQTAEAFRLDSTLNLTFSGNTHQNFGGLGERWLQGGSLWYFITPAGNFYRWNGRPVTSSQPLSGTLL